MKCLIGSNAGGAKCGVKGSLSKLVHTYHVDEGVRIAQQEEQSNCIHDPTPLGKDDVF
jgi:hypothetical protein